ncbi:hypothetical protein BDZ97DRAFT_1868417 [Flammula alnicola]|nr:hypothetical protein BDZ97DRAFT_1868417 [Flammula alnicola]
MQLFKSLLLGISLATFIVSALPCPDYSSESEIAEWTNKEILPRNNLFATHGRYSKGEAINFVEKTPLEKLKGFSKGAGTIHPTGKKDESTGHRLDMQGMTAEGYHNIQVQVNGQRKGKSTVGGLLVKGDLSSKRTRKELIFSIMHPSRDRNGKEYLRKLEHKDGKAPTHPDGRIKTNAEARKGGPRKPKSSNPESKKNLRNAAKKAAKKAARQ